MSSPDLQPPSAPIVEALRAELSAAAPEALSTPALRLARRVPEAAAVLDRLPLSPLQRALCGLSPAPALPDPENNVEQATLAGLSLLDGGARPPAAWAARLEAAAEGDPLWWAHAARLHHAADEARERQSRMRLSEQDLPYVFPGELHPLMIDVLGSADRVFSALHIDWMRKLTAWITDALPADQAALGLWFWPVLRFMDERALVAPIRRLERARRAPPGGRGLALAYAHRAGLTPAEARDPAAFARLPAADRLLLALAVLSDHSA